MKGVSLPLGFTFSFPCRQNSLDQVARPSFWEEGSSVGLHSKLTLVHRGESCS